MLRKIAENRGKWGKRGKEGCTGGETKVRTLGDAVARSVGKYLSSHGVNESTEFIWLCDATRRGTASASGDTRPRSTVYRDNRPTTVLIEALNLFFSIIHDTIALGASRDERAANAARVKPAEICSRSVMKVCLINSHPESRRFHGLRSVSQAPEHFHVLLAMARVPARIHL